MSFPHVTRTTARRPRRTRIKRLTEISARRATPLALAVLFFILVSVSERPAHAGRSFTVKPAPAWVKDVAPGAEAGVGEDDRAGTMFLLDDHQTRVAGPRTERYYRHVKKILSPAGLEQAAEFDLSFEPSYQELVIHHVRIIREGQVINALVPSEINLIQQETELDQRLYNGQLSAVVFLRDVRVGDVIDYAYSVNGDNPVMGGRFSDEIFLADADRIQRLHLRLLWPSGRALQLRAQNTTIEPRVTQGEGAVEYVWEREGVPALEYEDYTPSWFDSVPRVELSEFASWADVVAWALPLYEAREVSPALRAKIEEWRKSSDDPARRLVSALRFVQDEVRYLGIELGRYSHEPSQPAKVFARRFGDCKDKSLLLVTILRELGIDARTAIVSTTARRALDRALPSPYAFDHVIVRASLDGRVYWLDATATHQRGTLEAYYPPEFERALVVAEGVDALEVIPAFEPKEPTTIVEEVYTVNNHASPASFEVTTTYRGPDADSIRQHLSQQSLNDLAKDYLNYYANADPSIKSEGTPRVSDDQEANVVVIRERYTIQNFWTEGAREIWADRIRTELGKPSISQRTAPVDVPHPKYLRQTIEVRLPEETSITADSGALRNDAFSLDYKFSRSGNTTRLEFTLRSVADHVPAPRATKYFEDLARMQKVTGYELTRGGMQGFAGPVGIGPSSSSRAGYVVAGVLLVLVIAAGFVGLVVWYVIRRERGASEGVRSWSPASHVVVGADPASAIRVSSDDDLLAHVRQWRSRCGRAFYDDGDTIEREGLTYNGQSLVLVRAKCGACGDARDAYFVKTQPAADGAPAFG